MLKYLMPVVLSSLCLHGYHEPKFAAYQRICREATEKEEVFSVFKMHPDYTDMLEHVSPALGQEYLKILLRDYPHLLTKIDSFRENDRYGNPLVYKYDSYGLISPTTLRYITIAGDIEKRFGSLKKMRVLEIGGGYGGLCKILHDLTGFASYTIIDVPDAAALAQKYLDRLNVKNVRCVGNTSLKKLGRFDIVISNYAFAEFDKEEQYRYIKEVLKGIKKGYMIWNVPFASPKMTWNEMEKALATWRTPLNKEPYSPESKQLVTWGGL